MQQFRPFASFQETNGVGLIEEQREEDLSGFPPNTTSPLNLLTGFTGQTIGTGTRTTEQLETISDTSPTSTGPLSLASALKATMSTNTTAHRRIVIIPGAKKRKRSNADSAIPAKHISSRLRHGIILAIVGVIFLTTLVSLTPLATGQGSSPVLISIGNWVHSQVLNWQVMSHDNTTPVAQNNSPDMPPMYLPKSQYVAIAQQDAVNAGISPDYFVRQINLESGFNPNAYSGSGAEGIAQFLPSTAKGLGINPWDPIQALRGAANLMASYNRQYGGNYAMALAAYNGGSGTVQYAVNTCGSNWMNCLPAETRNYIHVIMGI